MLTGKLWVARAIGNSRLVRSRSSYLTGRGRTLGPQTSFLTHPFEMRRIRFRSAGAARKPRSLLLESLKGDCFVSNIKMRKGESGNFRYARADECQCQTNYRDITTAFRYSIHKCKPLKRCKIIPASGFVEKGRHHRPEAPKINGDVR